MLLSVDTDLLDNTVKQVLKIAAGAGQLHFEVLKSDLRVSASNKGTGMAMLVPVKVVKRSDNTKFTFNLSGSNNPLLAAIAKRKNIKLEVDTGTVKVQADKYVAELVTTTADVEPILPEDVKSGKVKAHKLKTDVIDFIAKGISDIELKPILETYSFMPVSVRIDANGGLMSCYDNWHMAFTSNKEVSGKLNLTLPVSSLSILTKEFKGQSYNLIATDAALYAYNDSFEMSLTLPQQDEQNQISPESAFELATTIRKQKGINVSLNVEDMQSVVTNMEAVYSKGEHVDFSVDKELCTVIVKSTFGRVKSGVRCKSEKPVKFRTGFAFLRDALTKSPSKKLDITVVPDKMLYFTSGRRTVMLALLPLDE